MGAFISLVIIALAFLIVVGVIYFGIYGGQDNTHHDEAAQDETQK